MSIISIRWNLTKNLEMKPVFLRWHLDLKFFLSFFLSFFFLQFFLNKWPDPFFPAIQKKGESGGLIYSKATKVTIWVFHTIYRSFTDTTDLTQMDVIISHFMKK